MAEVAGATSNRKFGYNEGVSTSEVEIRSEDANLTLQTTAVASEIVSSDVNDDGVPSGTLTLVSAVANTFATGTVTMASAQAADTVTVNGLLYTAVSGAKADNTEFSIDTSDDAAATDLADSITNDTRSGTVGDLSATSSTDTVTITTDVEGAAGNAVTLVSSNGTRLAVSGAGTLTSGVTADSVVVNGLTYTGVAGAKADNTEFSIDTGDTEAAADLVLSINADTRTPITVPGVDVTASSSSGIVTIDVFSGSDGNTVDIVGSTNITASAATLTDIDAAGAHTVYIEGLDASYNEVTESINLNGQTAVPLANNYYRVNRAYVTGGGTTLGNQGTITIRKVSGAVTLIQIPAGKGQSQSTSFTVPINKKINIKQFDFAVGSSSNNAVAVQVNAWFKLPTDAIWRQGLSRIESNGSDHIQFNHDEFEFGAGTDIRVTAIKLAGTGDAIVDVGYSYRIYTA